MPAGFVAVELVEAADAAGNLRLVPDVEDLDDLKRFATHEAAAGLWHLHKGRHAASFRKLGLFSGNQIFEVTASTPQAWNALSTRLGAKTFTYVEAKDRPAAQITWLQGEGFVVVRSHAEGDAPAPTDPIEAVHPQLVMCGQNPIAAAIEAPVDGRVYYRGAW